MNARFEHHGPDHHSPIEHAFDRAYREREHAVNDQELIARARQLAEDGVRSAEAQALARELLRQLADRLAGRAATQVTEANRDEDRLMSCPCGRGDYELCTRCPYDWCSVHGHPAQIAEG
jgi:hypothetical protein